MEKFVNLSFRLLWLAPFQCLDVGYVYVSLWVLLVVSPAPLISELTGPHLHHASAHALTLPNAIYHKHFSPYPCYHHRTPDPLNLLNSGSPIGQSSATSPPRAPVIG